MSQKKKKKIKKTHHQGVMGRSDIPFAERLALKQHSDIAINREHSAKITMFCMSVAIHDLEGIGYKRIVEFSRYFKECIDEMYKDVEVGMVHAKRRLAQFGIEISGDLYVAPLEGLTLKEQEVRDNALQASQIANICGIIALHNIFKFGKEKLDRISVRVQELSTRYKKEGENFLLEEMEKIGFQIVNGSVVAYTEEDGTPISVAAAKKQGIYTPVF